MSVGIASTKSRSRSQRMDREVVAAPSIRNPGQMAEAVDITDLSRRTWIVSMVVILAIAAFLRFYDLDLVPLHHDEGVNGNFLNRLVREGRYDYNPENYHGPTLYYFAALFPRVLRLFSVQAQNSYGLTTTAIRFIPALFGLATVWLIFSLRRNLGTIGTLSAAFLLAISPGAVYLSRYFIHETHFVFFTLAIVVALLKYYEQAYPPYLIAAAASAALLFATKETAIISVAVLALAYLVTRIYWRVGMPRNGAAARTKKQKRQNTDLSFSARAGGPTRIFAWMLLAVAVFIAINVIFYSSFFSNWKGVGDAFKTFEYWTKTGKKDHIHPFLTYVWWLLLQEAPLLVLGAIGAMVSLIKPVNRFALFCGAWAFGLIAAYSLIAYKTPWLSLNLLVPLALSSGVALEWLYRELRDWQWQKHTRVYLASAIVIITISILPGTVRAVTQKQVPWKTFIPGYQTVDLNFYNYDNDDRYYVYVYAHTRRETLKLVAEIDRIAQRTHHGAQTGITIVAGDYWPLPWYLRDYNRVGYFGRMVASNEPIIIATQGQADEVIANFGDRYQQVHSGFNLAGSFPLRPGVDLLLFTRRELAR